MRPKTPLIRSLAAFPRVRGPCLARNFPLRAALSGVWLIVGSDGNIDGECLLISSKSLNMISSKPRRRDDIDLPQLGKLCVGDDCTMESYAECRCIRDRKDLEASWAKWRGGRG